MKILCLQLARHGDIYQTWPVLEALRRQFPEATIDFVVRERFAAAAIGLRAVNRVITLPMRDILAPLTRMQGGIEDALAPLNAWLKEFDGEPYDRICNLSFSPVSSYLVDILSGRHTLVTGYSRFSDGFLNIVDDASSYFYAQVGIDRSNRIHLSDIFALVAGVELGDSDFIVSPELKAWPKRLPTVEGEFVVVHPGASQKQKRCSPECWQATVDQLLARGETVVVIGAAGEDDFLSFAHEQNPRLKNFVGQTDLPELFAILSKAKALLGCDSVATHMAALTHTPTLNISFSSVRFWETGPRAIGSRVIWFESPVTTDPQRISHEFFALLEGRMTGQPIIVKSETFGVLYDLQIYQDDDFSWELTRALYMSQPFPTIADASVGQAFRRLYELASLGLEQIRLIEKGEQMEIAGSILDQIDHLSLQVERLVPRVGPVVRWFRTEKCRIGPGALPDILNSTRQLFQKLNDISQLYSVNIKMNESINRESLTWKS